MTTLDLTSGSTEVLNIPEKATNKTAIVVNFGTRTPGKQSEDQNISTNFFMSITLNQNKGP